MSRHAAARAAGWVLVLSGVATVAPGPANPLPGVAALAVGAVVLSLTERLPR